MVFTMLIWKAHHHQPCRQTWSKWVCEWAESAGTCVWWKQKAVGHYQEDNIVSGWCKLQGDTVNRHGWVATACRGRDTDKWNIFGGLNRRKWGSIWRWHAAPPPHRSNGCRKKTDCLARSLDLTSFNLPASYFPQNTHNWFLKGTILIGFIKQKSRRSLYMWAFGRCSYAKQVAVHN